MKKIAIISLGILVLGFSSCKKNVDAHVPPDVVFKTTSGYAYKDTIVGLQDTLTVGITATKTEDDLKSYNVSRAYDGATTTTTFYNYLVQDIEYNGFSKDVDIITRNQAGTEKWIFSIVDRDGNITQKIINITVQ
jgi:hypothetical protein